MDPHVIADILKEEAAPAKPTSHIAPAERLETDTKKQLGSTKPSAPPNGGLPTGLIAGPIYDRGYLRLLLVAGSLMVVFGMMMLSLSTEYWQALLAQAFCVGIGAGLLFVPTVSLIPTWFSTRIGLAVDFLWAVRYVGFIALATFLLPLAVMRTRVHAPKPRAMVDWTAFHDAPFMAFTLGVLLVFIAQSVLIFYISFYPADRGFTSTSLAF
ncbi:putative Monocarboxylate permease-like protein, mch4 [Seiridium unicorne]|uniref:Monocarboxylate permease-like protein, mch4 n=1 Tax=Seiridium unicorne TaxID=138068 RepID=A0ABR2V5T1_9PEZI